MYQFSAIINAVGSGTSGAFETDVEGSFVAIVDGIVVNATFNSRGAAQAAIPVERQRRKRHQRHLITTD